MTEDVKCYDCGSVCVTNLEEEIIPYLKDDGTEGKVSVTLPVRKCQKCDIAFTDWESEPIRHNALCKAQGIMNPDELRAVRQRHNLTEHNLANILGVKDEDIVRWEEAKAYMPSRFDRQLRALAGLGIAWRGPFTPMEDLCLDLGLRTVEPAIDFIHKAGGVDKATDILRVIHQLGGEAELLKCVRKLRGRV